MYTKVYQLDEAKYPADINQVRSTVLTLNGVSEVKVIEASNSLMVQFQNPLSEKQILSAINQHKKKVY